MFLLPHQLQEVISVKSSCSRSLEDNVVNAHITDQTIDNGYGSYRYLNRPLPKAVAGLHLLNPTIDESNLFITETPWSQDWSPTRENIPAKLGTPGELEKFRTAVHSYGIAPGHAQPEERHLPVFDQEHVPGDSIPAIHDHNHSHAEPRREYFGFQSPYPYATMENERSYSAFPKENTEYSQNIPRSKEFFTEEPVRGVTAGNSDINHWAPISVIAIILVTMGAVLVYSLMKQKSARPVVYAHIHPQFLG